MTGGTLIVGAGQAGVQLAVSLRDGGDGEPITLVGAEGHLPYQRPPLSKAFLAGAVDAASLSFRLPAFYDRQRIDVLTGDRVRELVLGPGDPVGAGFASTDHGRRLPFDRLALTVGARPRRLDVPGVDLCGVHYLRDLDDAERLRAGLGTCTTVVVIGGGFIGLEAAAAARSQGRAVTVVEAADRLAPRAVAPVISEFYRQAHERRGVTVRLAAAVTAIVGVAGRVAGVALGDGTTLPADLVLVGVGVIPRTELVAPLGIACDGGILVDRRARTSVRQVVAAGDCTVLADPSTDGGRTRLESVQNAVDQAKVAAATLAGRPAPDQVVPWFWSDQYDLKLQIAGLSGGHDHRVVRGDPATERFSVLYYRAGVLVAVEAVNHAPDYLTVRKALAQEQTIPAERAADAATALKGLVEPRTGRT